MNCFLDCQQIAASIKRKIKPEIDFLSSPASQFISKNVFNTNSMLSLNVRLILSVCLRYLKHLFAAEKCVIIEQELNYDNCEIAKAIFDLVYSILYICESIML